MEVDTILNSLNKPILRGDGVDGARNWSAGSELLKKYWELSGC